MPTEEALLSKPLSRYGEELTRNFSAAGVNPAQPEPIITTSRMF